MILLCVYLIKTFPFLPFLLEVRIYLPKYISVKCYYIFICTKTNKSKNNNNGSAQFCGIKSTGNTKMNKNSNTLITYTLSVFL